MIPSPPMIMEAKMRGSDGRNGALFSYVNLEERVPTTHLLRVIRLAVLDAEFAGLYASEGRPSIPPERLLRAALIQVLFSIGVGANCVREEP